MPSFHTDIDLTRSRGALELLGVAGDDTRDDDTLDEQEIETFAVEVTYEPGWFQPGKFSGPPEDCYPDDGEDPEIISVLYLDENEHEHELIDEIDNETYAQLVERAWDDQQVTERERDYDDAAADAYDDWMERFDAFEE